MTRSETDPQNLVKFVDLMVGQAFDVWPESDDPCLPYRRTGMRTYGDRDKNEYEAESMDWIVYIGEH